MCKFCFKLLKRGFSAPVILTAFLMLVACDSNPAYIDKDGYAPVAEAGVDRSASLGQLVELDGSASSDADEDELSYSWELLEKPVDSNASIDGADTSSPSITPDVDGVYLIQLIVNDGKTDSPPKQITITVGNVAGSDRDGDGVSDDVDVFPDDENESIDTDGDGTGNNADTDDDGDGVVDTDDAFPLDSSETTDTDGDGTGNNADTDDDGDGVADTKDAFPLDSSETTDTDGDGIGDNADTDTGTDGDGDGVIDADDAFPLDGSETTDTDGDGIGNNADTDDDGDGVADADDAFPLDDSETTDTDGDGTGNNTDTDDDGDGVVDTDDIFPLDATETADLDGDGIGDNADTDRDGDGVNNEDDFFPDDNTSSKVPTVTIDTPKTLITVGSSPITVSGTIDDSAARLVVNGVEITHTNGQFEVDVSLEEGLNNIVARGIDTKNHEGLATITVSLDKTPPYVTIQSQLEGQTVFTDKISIGGLVNDIVRGAVTEEDAVVRVNGQLAVVKNRSYLAENIRLVEGENTLEVIASDAVGNIGSKSIKINYEVQTNKIVSLVSGQAQSGVIFETLSEPLMIKLTANGVPVVDKTVVFRVIEGDGLLQPGTTSEANGAVVKTDDKGEANVSFKFGSRAGNGNHRVRARAVGFNGEIIFHASATYGDGNKAGVIAGNNQRGSVRQPLPAPFVLAVTDAGANLIPDADIEFKVTQGSGKFKNGEKTYLTKTDKDGRASVHFILGAEEGLDQQRVTATLVGTNAIAGFTASGFMPGDPGQTSVVGVVLDNQDKPIPAVTIRVDGTSRQAVTDDQGQFEILQVPVGPVHLLVEGSTTTRAGEWPTLSYNIVTVPGVKNPLASPIYLVELDMATATTVGVEDTELVLPEMPGFKLKVKAGSVTFPDGSKTGKLSVTAVNANKIPMPPPNGMQPQFIVTIQPHGAKFDPPAELTLPNVDGHLPGAAVEMYSYDHDLEEFVTIGLGTVSKDGSIITSNVGVGVIKAGWHCGSQAGGSGCCEGGGGGAPDCGECNILSSSGSCPVNYSCNQKKPDSTRLSNQVIGNCQWETCGGGDNPNPGDTPPDECGKCEGGKPAIEEKKALNKQEPDDCKELLCDGTFEKRDNETVALKAKGKNYECKKCSGGVEVSDEDAICDDKLYCTSANGERLGPDKCENGECKGEKIQAKILEAGGSVSLGAVTTIFQDYADYFRINLPALTGKITIGKKKSVCCEGKEKFTRVEEAGGTLSFKNALKFGGLFTVPPYGGSYEVDSFGLRASLEYGVFYDITVNGGLNLTRRVRECEDDICWAGSGVLTFGLDLGAKIDAKTNLVGTKCGPKKDKDCSLITVKAFASTGFSPVITVDCDRVSGGGAFRGVVATAQITAFEGSWYEFKVDKSMQLVQPKTFGTTIISLPAD